MRSKVKVQNKNEVNLETDHHTRLDPVAAPQSTAPKALLGIHVNYVNNYILQYTVQSIEQRMNVAIER